VEVLRLADPAEFRARTRDLLMADEARHNLHLGVTGLLVEHPEVYPEFHLWLVLDASRPVLAAFMTPPFNVAISRPEAAGAIEELANAIAEDGLSPPGVTAADPEVHAFARAWSSRTGQAASPHMAQRIYRLTSVRPVDGVPGRGRAATMADRELLASWMHAFAHEALPEQVREPGRIERILDLRLGSDDPGLFLWEDGGPVSMVGASGETPNGMRIGPVYTPPPSRRRGYASALTAMVSALYLARGRRFCFLYTDLLNPTSNRIYQRIGYEAVCDAQEYWFAPANDGDVTVPP
jgi:GNAT superfamily N-acetyltransferase